jgi:hypothetical protein
MKHLVQFKIFESYSDYNQGDIVLIRYKITGEITPVKIIKKYSKNSYLISYNTEDSLYHNAKDEAVNISQIIGPYQQLDISGDNTRRVTQNPAINPKVDNIIAVSNDKTISNDLAMP